MRRSRIVGRDSATSGRSSRRNGARSRVAGLDSATSTSRSSSVARRFTNVVLARRSVVGSSPRARPSAAFSEPIAAAVAFALPTSEERSSRRSAIAPEAREVLTSRRVSAPWSSVTSCTSRRELESSGLKYFADSPAASPRLSYCVAKPWITSARSPRVFSSSVLKIWSRSTTSVVACWVSVAPSSSSLASPSAGRQRDVAVGDAGQRRQPDHGARALAQRRVGLLHGDLDRRLVVVGQLDALDRADAAPADLHVVVDDELAGVLEQERVLRAGVAAEQEQPQDEREHERQRAHADGASDRHRPSCSERPLTPSPTDPARLRPGTGARTGCRSRTAPRPGPTRRSCRATAPRCTRRRAWRT